MQKHHSSWNSLNIAATAFLILLMLLMFFSAVLQSAQGQQLILSDDADGNGTLGREDFNREKERLKALESELLEREQKLTEIEKQLNEQEKSLKSLYFMLTPILISMDGIMHLRAKLYRIGLLQAISVLLMSAFQFRLVL